MPTFRFFWSDGTYSVLKGRTPGDAVLKDPDPYHVVINWEEITDKDEEVCTTAR